MVKCLMSELQRELRIATEYLEEGIGEQSALRAKLENQPGEKGKLLPSDQKQRAMGICSADEQTRNIMEIFFSFCFCLEREKQKKSSNKERRKQSGDFLDDQEDQESKKDSHLPNGLRGLNGGKPPAENSFINSFTPSCPGIPKLLLHK